MRGLNRQMRCALAVCVLLAPRAAQAQVVTTSFDQLRRVLNNGQTVIVTDTSGQRTKGKVADVSSSPPSVVHARSAAADVSREHRRRNPRRGFRCETAR